MKILIIPSWYITEDKPMSGIFFREQERALQDAGHEVCIVYPDLRFRLGSLKRGLFKAEDKPLTYICRGRTLTPFIERGRWPQRALMLEKLYKTVAGVWGRPDMVHLHSARMGVEALWLCKRHGLPLVYTEHYSGVTRRMSAPLEYAFRKTLAGCGRAIAVSESLRESMLPYRADTLYIPNLVDASQFRIFGGTSDKSGFVLAAMGSLIPVKGYDMLIRAFTAACGDMPGARLVIAGEGHERPRLEKLAAESGAAERIELCGAVERGKAPAFYNNCSCLVCSSYIETFGMTLIEALACGRPVISTECGGPQSIVTPCNGLLVPVGDIDELAKAMIYIYRNSDRYESQRLRDDCIASFGAETVTDKLMQVYLSAQLGYGR